LSLEITKSDEHGVVAKEVLAPSLLVPLYRLLDNAGYTQEETVEIISELSENPDLVYDVENAEFGNAEKLGLFDSAPAVEEALKNATSIATVMGTIGGIVAYPRDSQLEREEASADLEFNRAVNAPGSFANEANERP
jgi:chaperonin GroEL (HSP60 family)